MDFFDKLRADLEASTPGPWSAAKSDPEEGPQDVVMANEFFIASCHGCLGDGTADANARLIAAAPTLAKLALMVPELREALVLGEDYLPTEYAVKLSDVIMRLDALLAEVS